MSLTLRKDGTFIAVEVDAQAAEDPTTAAALTEACPVDIFTQKDDGTLDLVEKNLDECVLCRLCLDATEPGQVTVIKLYDNDAVLV